MASYIPSTDGALRDWANHFSTLITANPSTYGLMASDAATIAAAVGAYVPAYDSAVNPATRTKGIVAAKDSAKAAMLVTLRRYAQFIKLNLGVTNKEKQDLGITIDDTSRTPIPAPTRRPVGAVIDTAALQHTLRFVDEATPNKRGKPETVLGMELYFVLMAAAPATPPTPPDQLGTGMTLFGVVTRPTVTVTHEPSAAGKVAIYYARWVTRTGLTGPWSDPIFKVVMP